ncbi:hypothetical protein L9F63_028196 [Diploptera punctata]|uniref:Uncharacterized protein n=1 Tax=Diploptera punctata TaxID=6984 RepID=A0AAD8EEX9_DIPPU|nr:hypothetical protein L9F63_028196 [Diploptera punctata]
MILNPNCPVGILLDYIQNVMLQSNIPFTSAEKFEFDLCDENGQLKNLPNLEPWTNGYETGIFTSRATYILVIIEYDVTGTIIRCEPVNKTSHHYNDLVVKIKRQLTSATKQIKIPKLQGLQTSTEKLRKTSDKASELSTSGVNNNF